MVSGIMMAITASDPSPSTGYKTMAAATMPDVKMPVFMGINDNPGIEALSEDLVRDLAKKKGVLDTVFITKTDTVKEQVTKVKWRKVPVPSPIMEIDVTAHRDTVLVPVYYLATQVGTKEGPTGECISVYEVHKVDEICTDTINSSVQPVTELDNDVGE
jgi:hypothetical protein